MLVAANDLLYALNLIKPNIAKGSVLDSSVYLYTKEQFLFVQSNANESEFVVKVPASGDIDVCVSFDLLYKTIKNKKFKDQTLNFENELTIKAGSTKINLPIIRNSEGQKVTHPPFRIARQIDASTDVDLKVVKPLFKLLLEEKIIGREYSCICFKENTVATNTMVAGILKEQLLDNILLPKSIIDIVSNLGQVHFGMDDDVLLFKTEDAFFYTTRFMRPEKYDYDTLTNFNIPTTCTVNAEELSDSLALIEDEVEISCENGLLKLLSNNFEDEITATGQLTATKINAAVLREYLAKGTVSIGSSLDAIKLDYGQIEYILSKN